MESTGKEPNYYTCRWIMLFCCRKGIITYCGHRIRVRYLKVLITLYRSRWRGVSMDSDTRGRILLVDDEPLNLKLLSHTLQAKGFETTIALSGTEALQLLAAAVPPPDIILLDVIMPGIGGYELCRRLKDDQKYSKIPVIFLTALTESEDIVKGFNAGAVDYVKKPFNVAELLARVEAHLEIKHSRETIERQKAELEERKTDLEAANATLYQRSITDSLTGLYNRQYVLDRLGQEMERSKRYRGIFSVLMLDIDHFKQVNDTYGHVEGDAALIRFSQATGRSLRNVDILGRYGGEEFLAILPETDLKGAVVAAERIRLAMSETGNPGLAVRPMTASIGVAQYHGEDEKEFINIADALLYKAKQSGRNTVMFRREAGVEAKRQ
jgi:diguanylate cyclase (GGDEF)-like protein